MVKDKFTKDERKYQNSKPYDFRDLEVSLLVKRNEAEMLKKEVKRLTEENAGLRYDVKKYDKMFQGRVDHE